MPSVRVDTVKTFGFDVAATSDAVEQAESNNVAATTGKHRRNLKGDRFGILRMSARQPDGVLQRGRKYARLCAKDHSPGD
jgi:hypothetical protein